MPGEEFNRNSTDYVIGQLTASLESTTKALHDITDRLQIVTMTVETLNSKLNAISDLYSKKLEVLEAGILDMKDRQSRDYARLNRIEQDMQRMVSVDDAAVLEEEQNEKMEAVMKKHADSCVGSKSSFGSEQRMFFVILSVLSVVSTIVALVK